MGMSDSTVTGRKSHMKIRSAGSQKDVKSIPCVANTPAWKEAATQKYPQDATPPISATGEPSSKHSPPYDMSTQISGRCTSHPSSEAL